jgi:hypothetical protein
MEFEAHCQFQVGNRKWGNETRCCSALCMYLLYHCHFTICNDSVCSAINPAAEPCMPVPALPGRVLADGLIMSWKNNDDGPPNGTREHGIGGFGNHQKIISKTAWARCQWPLFNQQTHLYYFLLPSPRYFEDLGSAGVFARRFITISND